MALVAVACVAVFIVALIKEILDKAAELASLRGEAAELRTKVTERDATLAERDAEAAELRTKVTERDATLAERDAEVTKLTERDTVWLATLAEREVEVTKLRGALVNDDVTYWRDKAEAVPRKFPMGGFAIGAESLPSPRGVTKLRAKVSELRDMLAKRNAELATLRAEVTTLRAKLRAKEAPVQSFSVFQDWHWVRAAEITELRAKLAERETELAMLRADVDALREGNRRLLKNASTKIDVLIRWVR